MYFFVDESGHTGANLFDAAQPVLYYGVLSSKFNLDYIGTDAVAELRALLGVERLHANELGMGGLVQISKGLIFLQNQLDLRFDFHMVYKHDHVAISFFDQVFDQGINPAVPWSAYWTPLRYMILWKVAILFDEETLRKAWRARIERNDERADLDFIDVCKTLLDRIGHVPDERSRQIIQEALLWAIDNPRELHYNARSATEASLITPNLIGFQSVMHSIADRLTYYAVKSPVIVVDQQSQFNATQRFLADFFAKAKGAKYDFRTGLPQIDFTGMPEAPLIIKSSTQSVGLELADIYLWLFKRLHEGRDIAEELKPLLRRQINHGLNNEISLKAIAERWTEWFEKLPEPTEEQWKAGKELMDVVEDKRIEALAADKQRKKLLSDLG